MGYIGITWVAIKSLPYNYIKLIQRWSTDVITNCNILTSFSQRFHHLPTYIQHAQAHAIYEL